MQAAAEIHGSVRLGHAAKTGAAKTGIGTEPLLVWFGQPGLATGPGRLRPSLQPVMGRNRQPALVAWQPRSGRRLLRAYLFP